MVDLLEYDAKVVRNGDSLQVNIPAYLRKSLDIDKGDLVTMKLVSVKKNFDENKRAVAEYLTPNVQDLIV